jgi:hypothetical protein
VYIDPDDPIDLADDSAPVVPMVDVAVDAGLDCVFDRVDPGAVVVEDESEPMLAFVRMKRSLPLEGDFEVDVESAVDVVSDPVVPLLMRSACCRHPVTVMMF